MACLAMTNFHHVPVFSKAGLQRRAAAAVRLLVRVALAGGWLVGLGWATAPLALAQPTAVVD